LSHPSFRRFAGAIGSIFRAWILRISGLFTGIFGHFSVENMPFSGEIRTFPEVPFLHCGTLCAFSRTSKIFPESAFYSATTRGFFTLRALFSFPKAN
jgi:hypothetical protein